MATDLSLRAREEQLCVALFQKDQPGSEASFEPGINGSVAPRLPAATLSVYRRLVRGNFHSAIRQALPISARLLGTESIESLIDAFLESRPGQIRALWQVPAAFSAWYEANPQPDLPNALTELIHFECVELEILYAPDSEPVRSPNPPTPAARIEADTSARLLAYRHPVHRMTSTTMDFPACSPSPHFLLAWRVDEKMERQEISVMTAKLLMHCGTEQSIATGLELLRNEGAMNIDTDAVLRALAVLQGKGALVDFPTGD